jgi:DNA/RNA endonuclease YhcR with UshA esterase domain
MKAFVPAVVAAVVAALGFSSTLALAQPIAPAEAQAHAGQSVTVEGTASEVHASPSGRVTFINIGGSYPDNPFTAVILAKDAGKFPNLNALEGKTVDVSGPVLLYKGKPEIIVTDAAQLKAK